MNAVPEWFTVEPDDSTGTRCGTLIPHQCKSSRASRSATVAVRLEAGKALRLVVRPATD